MGCVDVMEQVKDRGRGGRDAVVRPVSEVVVVDCQWWHDLLFCLRATKHAVLCQT